MPATFLPSAAPPHAVLIWADHLSIYVELPSKRADIPPTILSFRRTESGLSKALGLLMPKLEVSAPALVSLPKPKTPRASLAEALLRKNGILK